MSAAVLPVVGIVGGVGSGKSSLARRVAERLPAAVLDADRVGHDVLLRPEVREQVREHFGTEVFDAEGQIVRRELAKRVFGEGAQPQRDRQALERIMHPLIRRELEEQIESLRRNGDCRLVLMDAAVMLESGWSQVCDLIVYVDVPFAVRLARVAGRGWTEEELRRREASQWPVERKRAAADVVIDNSGDLDSAARRLLVELQARLPSLADGVEEPAARGTQPAGLDRAKSSVNV
jgi:dephospho-CoA kinase